MVSACAGCNQMAPWGAAVTGVGAAFAYLALSELAVAMRVDDPLDAFAVHFGGGMWGLISACFLIDNGILYALLPANRHDASRAWAQLGWQAVCALAIVAWSATTLTPPLLLLRRVGKLRVRAEVELKGLDIFMHGEAAYPLTAYGHGWDEEFIGDGSSPKNGKNLSHFEHPEHFRHQIHTNNDNNGNGNNYNNYGKNGSRHRFNRNNLVAVNA